MLPWMCTGYPGDLPGIVYRLPWMCTCYPAYLPGIVYRLPWMCTGYPAYLPGIVYRLPWMCTGYPAYLPGIVYRLPWMCMGPETYLALCTGYPGCVPVILNIYLALCTGYPGCVPVIPETYLALCTGYPGRRGYDHCSRLLSCLGWRVTHGSSWWVTRLAGGGHPALGILGLARRVALLWGVAGLLGWIQGLTWGDSPWGWCGLVVGRGWVGVELRRIRLHCLGFLSLHGVIAATINETITV